MSGERENRYGYGGYIGICIRYVYIHSTQQSKPFLIVCLFTDELLDILRREWAYTEKAGTQRPNKKSKAPSPRKKRKYFHPKRRGKGRGKERQRQPRSPRKSRRHSPRNRRRKSKSKQSSPPTSPLKVHSKSPPKSPPKNIKKMPPKPLLGIKRKHSQISQTPWNPKDISLDDLDRKYPLLNPEHDDDSDAVYTINMIIMFGGYEAAASVHTENNNEYDLATFQRGHRELKDEGMLNKNNTFRHFRFTDPNSYEYIYIYSISVH